MSRSSPWSRPAQRPLVLGHRGDSIHAVENTLESFCAARDAGADGVEFDVRLCATGEPVIYHDENLARMAGRGEVVSRLSLDRVRAVRLPGDCHIPTLDDVFATFAGTDFALNVELKTTGFRGCVALVEAVLAAIERHGVADNVLLSSFDPIAMWRMHQRTRRVRTGFLFHGGQLAPFREAWFARLLRPPALHPHYKLVTGQAVERWRQGGHAVNTWTVDHRTTQRRLAAAGVDAIMTNDPAACLANLSPD